MEFDLLAALDEPDRRLVLRACVRHRYAKGDTLVWEGDPGDTLHLLAKGRVAVHISTPMGETATLAVLGPGGFFGDQALIDDEAVRTATVSALEPTETRALHRRDFDRLLVDHPSVERLLVLVLSAQVRRLSDQVVEALYVPVEARVVRRLADLAEIYSVDDGARAMVAVTQDTLASLAGTTRPTANRVLKVLEADGLVVLHRGRIEVPDVTALTDRG